MFRLFKLLRLARAYKKAFKAWNKANNDQLFEQVENAEHDLLDYIVDKIK